MINVTVRTTISWHLLRRRTEGRRWDGGGRRRDDRTGAGEARKWSQRGQPEKEHEVRQSEGEKMEAIAGPGTEIKAVLHEINGGLHKQYMNHSLPLQWERWREWDGSRQRENRAAGSLTTTSKVPPFSKRLHNTSGKVTGGEEGGRRRGWEKSYRCAGEEGK